MLTWRGKEEGNVKIQPYDMDKNQPIATHITYSAVSAAKIMAQNEIIIALLMKIIKSQMSEQEYNDFDIKVDADLHALTNETLDKLLKL